MNHSILVGLLLFIVHEGAALFFILGEKEHRCFYEDYHNDVMVKFEFNSTVHKSSTPIGLHVTMTSPKKEVMLSKEYGSRSVVNFRTGEPGQYSLCVKTNSTKWAMYAKDTVMVHFRLNADYIMDHEDGEDEEERHQEPDNHEQDSEHDVEHIKERQEEHDKEHHEEHDEEHHEEHDEEHHENSDEDEGEHIESVVTQSPLYGLYERIRTVKKDVNWLLEMQNTHREIEAKFRVIAEVTNSRVITWAVIQLVILLATGWWQIRSLKSFFIAKKLV